MYYTRTVKLIEQIRLKAKLSNLIKTNEKRNILYKSVLTRIPINHSENKTFLLAFKFQLQYHVLPTQKMRYIVSRNKTFFFFSCLD